MRRSALGILTRVRRAITTNKKEHMPFHYDITRQQKLLAMYRSLLAQYLRQRQDWERTEVPEFLSTGITVIRSNIRDVKGTLRGWKIVTADNPGDEGPDDDIAGEVQHQRKLLMIHRKNLMIYLSQQEQFVAGQTSPAVLNALERTRKELQRIKAILRGFGVVVDDIPGEEEQ